MSETDRKIFAFGDIHGCAYELQLLIEKLPLEDNSLIVFLGDYIDRGESSKEVVDIILELKKKYDVITLMGNHEEMLLDFVNNSFTAQANSFIYNGGGATLASYGDQHGNYDIPQEHLDFYTNLKEFHETDDYFFVHAGVPDVPLEDLYKSNFRSTLLWVRDEFFESSFSWDKLIIHGHSPVKKVENREKRINVDTGCVFGGQLTVIELPSKKFHSIKKQAETQQQYLKNQSSARKAVRFYGQLPVYVIHEKEIYVFETVNYSEFGMLICDKTNTTSPPFEDGQMISGNIKGHGDEEFQFQGIILHPRVKSSGIFYAVQFTKTPFDFQNNNIK